MPNPASPLESSAARRERKCHVTAGATINGIVEAAERLHQKSQSWVQFFRLVFGVDGLIRSAMQDSERYQFEQSEGYAQLQEMLADLRTNDRLKSDFLEPQQMITIRIPLSLHKLLIRESNELELSLNKLAITKLLRPAEPRFTPLQVGKRRGRRSPVDHSGIENPN